MTTSHTGKTYGAYAIAANITGLGKPTISRLINGHRKPTLSNMEAIESIGWSSCDQVASLKNGTYPVDLQTAIERHAIRTWAER